nr:hypothetical protein [Tanacetum cinerariifolium]
MAMKLRKCENNLMNWRQDQVIGIGDSDDEVKEDNNNNDIVSNGVIVGVKFVDEIPNATVPVDDDIVGDVFTDDDVPKERVEERVKITGKRNLCQAFDKDEDDV